MAPEELCCSPWAPGPGATPFIVPAARISRFPLPPLAFTVTGQCNGGALLPWHMGHAACAMSGQEPVASRHSEVVQSCSKGSQIDTDTTYFQLFSTTVFT